MCLNVKNKWLHEPTAKRHPEDLLAEWKESDAGYREEIAELAALKLGQEISCLIFPKIISHQMRPAHLHASSHRKINYTLRFYAN